MKKTTIPVFFASDDAYVPLMSVAIMSLIKNASPEYNYEIIILNANNVSAKNKEIINEHKKDNFKITFFDISDVIAPFADDLSLRLRDYYSLAIYYRIFIPRLFPQFDKVIYLDGDLVVTGDISRLYNVEIGDNLVAGIRDQLVCNHQEFIDYIQDYVGVKATEYFNSGVLLMNTKQFRKEKIEEKIIDIVAEYNFETICPDQDHLNILCVDKKILIDTKFNKMPIFEEGFDDNDIVIVHYNSFEKPWHRNNVLYANIFWENAKDSPYYEQLVALKASITPDKLADIDAGAVRLLGKAVQLGRFEENSFRNILKF